LPPTTSTTIWHNPRCSKSREAKAILEEYEISADVREYLKDPPTRDDLEQLMTALGIDDPRVMMRVKDDAYSQLELDGADSDELLDAIVANPILLERPIVVRDGKAVIGRPPRDITVLF
jgi:arsenate reductase